MLVFENPKVQGRWPGGCLQECFVGRRLLFSRDRMNAYCFALSGCSDFMSDIYALSLLSDQYALAPFRMIGWNLIRLVYHSNREVCSHTRFC